MTTLPKYERYKDSGVEWLGEVPEHWNVRRNLGVFDERKECNQPEEELLSVTVSRGIIRQSEITAKKDSSNDDKSKYKVVRVGDLAYNKMRAWQGALGISAFNGIVSPAYVVLTPRNQKLSKYFHYLYRTPQFITEANRLSYGLCDDMNSLRYEHFKTSYTPLPPDDEIDRIVAFLDQKTAEIDALIAKKQRQIELLDEQKAILINRAVTRGLNPNAKLKPSGIEWIGEIPEHWEVKNLKYVSTKIGTGRTPGTVAQAEDLPDGVHWYTPGDYRDSGFLDASERRAKSTRLETVETFPAGSLFYIGIGATLGRVNLSLHEAGCNQQINVIVINSSAHSAEYMLHLLNAGREYIFSSSDFTTLPILNRSKTATLSVVAPSKAEQEAIAAYCADLVLKIQAVQAKVAENIQSLQSLRSTLIAHAVTGRIKIN
ncbi:MAG: restriction endonuclease subunit S [Luteolibacter sp.]|jgi:type I restriction enzyme S subunit|nr:restriction endonuclease subunit S [Luteolibacter sp.]